MGIWIKTEILLGMLHEFKKLIMWMDQVDWLIVGGIFMVWLMVCAITLIVIEGRDL